MIMAVMMKVGEVVMLMLTTRIMTVMRERARSIEQWSCGCFQLGLDPRALLLQTHGQDLKKLHPSPVSRDEYNEYRTNPSHLGVPVFFRRPCGLNFLPWTQDLRCLPMLQREAEGRGPGGACLSLQEGKASFAGLSTRNSCNLPGQPRRPRCVTAE